MLFTGRETQELTLHRPHPISGGTQSQQRDAVVLAMAKVGLGTGNLHKSQPLPRGIYLPDRANSDAVLHIYVPRWIHTQVYAYIHIHSNTDTHTCARSHMKGLHSSIQRTMAEDKFHKHRCWQRERYTNTLTQTRGHPKQAFWQKSGNDKAFFLVGCVKKLRAAAARFWNTVSAAKIWKSDISSVQATALSGILYEFFGVFKFSLKQGVWSWQQTISLLELTHKYSCRSHLNNPSCKTQ